MDSMEYFDIATQVGHCTNVSEVKKHCSNVAEIFECEYFLFGAYYPQKDRVIVISGYPEEWRERYEQNSYLAVDPMVRHCWSSSKPLRWADVELSNGKKSQAERKFLNEAKSFYLNDGISVPTHGSGIESGMFSLCSRLEPKLLTLHDEMGLQMVAQAIHEKVKTIALAEKSNIDFYTSDDLTNREKECLVWTANGKTTWEISKILRISESTVTYHLKNSIEKMNASNRPQAVAKAIAKSQIMPFSNAC